jgi:hypothetical protein
VSHLALKGTEITRQILQETFEFFLLFIAIKTRDEPDNSPTLEE